MTDQFPHSNLTTVILTNSLFHPLTVCVNDDLTTGKTSVTVRTTNDETTGRIEMVHRLLIQIFGRDDRLDDVFHELFLDLLLGDVFGVLGGNHNGVHTFGDGSAVLHLEHKKKGQGWS